MLGNNIKIHFAGSDNKPSEAIACDMAGVNYNLFSCYPFIKSKKLGDNFKIPQDKIFVQRVIQHKRKQTIMDSGLFTLMFGAGKEQKQTIHTLEVWQDKMAEFVKANNLKCACVEVDCQKVLGVEEAWYFRERMKKVIPNNRHINVFHLEDGKKGLDRLIEFSDYLAISCLQVRDSNPKQYQQNIKKLTFYIKNKKPEIDIHLLGCTVPKILKENSYCTSADSTSWIAGIRYGRMPNAKYHEKQIKQEVRDKLLPEIMNRWQEYKKTPTANDIRDTQTSYISAMMCKQIYTECCGNQD